MPPPATTTLTLEQALRSIIELASQALAGRQTTDDLHAIAPGALAVTTTDAAIPLTTNDNVHLPSLIAQAFGLTRSEARRLLLQGAVTLDDKRLPAPPLDIRASTLLGPHTLQIGLRRRAIIATESPGTPKPDPKPDKAKPEPVVTSGAVKPHPHPGPPPRTSNPRPDVGTNWRKHPSGRTCQISAITDTHAILYWPDADHPGATHPAQTQVRLDRFNRTREWEPIP